MVNASRRRAAPPPKSSDDEQQQPSPAKRVKLERVSVPSRRRVSPDSDDGQARPENDEEEEEADDDDADYEMNEEDISDEAAMQARAVERAKRGKYEGKASEAGVIKQINLVDFMCHRHLTVDFGAKMNFLVGHNGSGKSAILTAIAVALGGKAAATGRGSGIKDLIKRDADRAIITLTLSNEGHHAYRPKDKDYSPNIVIERIIHKSGSSEWKFRATKDGKILGKKKAELDAITSTFSIDVDQPLTILTQDQARSFLQNADDTQLYRFFMRGTMLMDLSQAYDDASQRIDSMKNQAARMIEDIPELQQKAKDLQRKSNADKRIKDQKDQAARLKNEQGWALVIEKERARDVHRDEIDDLDAKLLKLDDNIEELGRELKPMEHEVEQQEKDIREYNDTRKPIEAERRVAKTDYDELQRQMVDLNSDVKDKQKSIRDSDRDIADYDQRITAKKEQLNRGRDAAQVKLEKELTEYEAMEYNVQRDLPKKEEALDQAVAAKRQGDDKVDEAQRQAGMLTDEIQKLKESVSNLENQRTNRLAAFGHNIDAVLAEIDRARWHTSKPVGPLGRYIQLNDNEFKYKDVMESLLGSLMCAFAVQDSKDKNLLQKILTDCKNRRGYRPGNNSNSIPTIHQNSADLFDYSNGDYTRYGETILSKLTISDEYVKRVMINVASIERIFVTPDMGKASSEIERILAAGIPNVTVYSAADLYRQEGTRGSKDGGPIQQFRGNRMFTKDVAAEYNELKAKLDVKIAEREFVDTEKARLIRERDALQLNWTQAKVLAALDKVRMSIPKFADQIAKIKANLNERPSDDITAFETMKREANTTKMSTQIILDGLLAEQASHAQRLATAKAKYEGLQVKLDDFAPERNRKQERLIKLTEARAAKKGAIAHYKESKKRTQENRDKAQERYEAANAMVQQWTEAMMLSCPERIHTNRDSKVVDAERIACEKEIAAAEKIQGFNTDHVNEQFTKAVADLADHKVKQKTLHDLVLYYEQHMKKRAKWWQQMRISLTIKARTTFVWNTNKRGFDGRLLFDHERAKLKMTIRTTPGAESQNAAFQQMFKSAKHLSGGERSFSTISFLLAMWETAEGGLRCLDEWDVFMDGVNRNLMANMLIDGAKESDGKQYILITPQSMQGMKLESSADTKIIKMAPPDRNQETLNM